MTISHSSDCVDVDDPEPPLVFDDVMIDIETMSLHAHKALILSIGMIEFNAADMDGLKIGSRSGLVLQLAPQLACGRRVDTGTQEFWAKQSPEASSHWLHPHTPLTSPGEALGLVSQFCHGRKRVWANGTQFDLSNLKGLAEDFGVNPETLWHYQAARDMRTFVKETEATRLVPIGDALDIVGVAHEPVYDCIVQAWQVWSHYREK